MSAVDSCNLAAKGISVLVKDLQYSIDNAAVLLCFAIIGFAVIWQSGLYLRKK